jgi:hypothetical protein
MISHNILEKLLNEGNILNNKSKDKCSKFKCSGLGKWLKWKQEALNLNPYHH